MTTITCLVATVLALITIPLVILWRLSLTKQQNVQRLASKGWTWTRIGNHYGVHRSTVRRWAMA